MSTTRERPRAEMWTERSMVEWGKRCSKCERWRLRACYHELHGGGHWWRECLSCTIGTLGDSLVDKQELLEPIAKIANEEVCPVCKLGPGLHGNEDCPFVPLGLDAALTEELARRATQLVGHE